MVCHFYMGLSEEAGQGIQRSPPHTDGITAPCQLLFGFWDTNSSPLCPGEQRLQTPNLPPAPGGRSSRAQPAQRAQGVVDQVYEWSTGWKPQGSVEFPRVTHL